MAIRCAAAHSLLLLMLCECVSGAFLVGDSQQRSRRRHPPPGIKGRCCGRRGEAGHAHPATEQRFRGYPSPESRAVRPSARFRQPPPNLKWFQAPSPTSVRNQAPPPAGVWLRLPPTRTARTQQAPPCPQTPQIGPVQPLPPAPALVPANSSDPATGIPQPKVAGGSLQYELMPRQSARPGGGEAAVVLGEIVRSLEKLKLESSLPGMEGASCLVDGSWVSEAAGVRLDVTRAKGGRLTVMVADRTPPQKDALLDRTWVLSGLSPLREGGPFVLTAISEHGRKMAVFQGSCRVCEGVEMVAGLWEFSRGARDCQDTHLSFAGHRDVFRREVLHGLKAAASDADKVAQHRD